MQILRLVALVLLIVGGLNWGLVGLFQFNLVEMLFGAVPIVERFVYVLVGLTAVVLAIRPKTWRSAPLMA